MLRGFKCKYIQIAAASLAALVDESFLVSYLDRQVSSFVTIECESAADVFFLWMTIKRPNQSLKGKYIRI